MGSAVIFGLSFATGLTLLVVPALYYLVARATDYMDRKLKIGKYSESDEDRKKIVSAE